jgi:predicted ATP-binding protein involved in virulence
MRIAAINYKKGVNAFTTINFGGKYVYVFDNEKDKIERHENRNYIDNFYSYNKDIILENITAIVGENGSGKTTTLEDIIHLMKRNFREFSKYTCIYEKYNVGNVEETIIINSLNYENLDFKFSQIDPKLEESESLNSQVIYYSPFVDFRDSIDEIINLKNDYIIKQDYAMGNLKNEDSYKTDPLFMHKRANEKRFMEFRNNKPGKELLQILKIPFESRFTIKFNEFRTPNFSNVPTKFITLLKDLYLSLKGEQNKIRNSQEPASTIQKNLLKTYILESLMNQFVNVMNEEHEYLQEGTLPGSDSLVFNNTQDHFYWFLENHQIEPRKRIYTSEEKPNSFQALPVGETKDFLNYINSIIDNLPVNSDEDSSYFDWDNRAIRLDEEEVLRLFDLEDKYLLGLSKYYSWGNLSNSEQTLLDIKRIISFEFSRYKLSSGEVSFLNLFSRFYSYFNNEYFKKELTSNFSYYYIFLDEADLGFHPKWKVKFIDTWIKFVESFFSDNRINAKVQIIFTTHDPLTLSDIPNHNVHYLSRENSPINSIRKSFGANIYDLLNDSFFLESPIGKFAENKIDEVINWLNYKKDRNKKLYHIEKDQEYYKKIIELIDEPIIKNQLKKMYIDVTKDTSFIEKEIERLQKLLSKK